MMLRGRIHLITDYYAKPEAFLREISDVLMPAPPRNNLQLEHQLVLCARSRSPSSIYCISKLESISNHQRYPYAYQQIFIVGFNKQIEMNFLNKASNFLDKMSHNISHKQGENGWSVICGGVEGQPFEFVNLRYMLIGVKGRSGALIDKLQFLFIDPQTGAFQQTPSVGGNGGSQFVITCPVGQWITKVHVWSGSHVDAIQLQTNTGMKTAKIGGGGGKEHVIDATNKRICGVKGRSSKFVDQICFAITK